MTPQADKRWMVDQAALRSSFRGRSGVVADALLHLLETEQRNREGLMPQVRGTTLILDCFQDFVLRSFRKTRKVAKITDTPQLCVFIATFRAFRASYLTYFSGYYFESAAILRGVGENVVLLAAAAKQIITRDDLFEGGKEARKRATRSLIAGDESGLTKEDRANLRDLFETLGMHVHGSKLVSASLFGRAVHENELPSIEPTVNPLDASHYCNVAVCLAWGMLRVMATLADRPDTAKWREQFHLLDRACDSYVSGWDRPIARAYHRWIASQLSFSPEDGVSDQFAAQESTRGKPQSNK